MAGFTRQGDVSGESEAGDQTDCGAALKPLMPDPKLCIPVNENDGRLRYGPGWVLQSADPSGRALTSHSTNINGSSVTIDFTGTSIIVFGTVFGTNTGATPSSGSYSVDGRRAIDLSLPASDKCIPNQQFFQSPIVPPGPHNLTIIVSTTGTPYVLDYVWFCGPTKPTADSITTGVQLSYKKFSQAIIIGSILGGVFLIAIVALAWRRKMRRKLWALPVVSTPLANQGSYRSVASFTFTGSPVHHTPAHPNSEGAEAGWRRQSALPTAARRNTLPESPALPPRPSIDGRSQPIHDTVTLDSVPSTEPPPYTLNG